MSIITLEQQLEDVLRRRREVPSITDPALDYLMVSREEMMGPTWAKARQMCDWYGGSVEDIGASIAKFRYLRTVFAALEREEMVIRAALNGKIAPPRAQLAPATVVHFNQVRAHWDSHHQQWSSDNFVYIGRAMPELNLNLTHSIWANPFRITEDTDQMRYRAVMDFGDWLAEQDHLLARLEELRGKILVCWCKPRRCHGDVLVQLLKEASHATP